MMTSDLATSRRFLVCVFLTLSFVFAIVVGLVVFFTAHTHGPMLAETVGAGAILFGAWGAWHARYARSACMTLMRAAHAEHVMTLSVAGDEARALSLAVLQSIPFVRHTTIAPGERCLTAKTRWSSKSFGERLSIGFEAKDARTTNIRIESRPLTPTVIIDNGKNAENVDRIRTLLATIK